MGVHPCPHPLSDTRADSGQRASCCVALGEKWNQEAWGSGVVHRDSLRGRAGRDMERAEVPLGGLEGVGAGLEEWVG